MANILYFTIHKLKVEIKKKIHPFVQLAINCKVTYQNEIFVFFAIIGVGIAIYQNSSIDNKYILPIYNSNKIQKTKWQFGLEMKNYYEHFKIFKKKMQHKPHN